MEPQAKRPGSVALLVGLVLLLTAAGAFIAFVPIVDCPESAHYGIEDKWGHYHCRRCDSWVNVDANKISLLKKWRWTPPPERDEFELYMLPRERK
jgi:hypothetical protein